MLDIKYIRENIEELKKAIVVKKLDLNLNQLISVDDKRKELIAKVDELRHHRNEAAEKRDIEQGRKIKQQLENLEEDLKVVTEDFDKLMVKVPNIPSKDTPEGNSDADNVEIYKWGEIPKFGFTPKNHIELGKALDILDLERGAKVGGYRGYFLKNEGVMLVMAVMNYALNKMVTAGFKPMIPPTLVKENVLFGSGYFKGSEYDPEVDEIYEIATADKNEDGSQNKEKKFLVGTAEAPLLAYYANETLKEEDLPIKLTGFSQCYRSEIGSYGKDTKGIYRVHEFFKVEQIILATADTKQVEDLQQEMLKLSMQLHEDLGLPYRELLICTGDLGVGKYRQYDLEAWMPGLNRYGETGSASIFLDWQSRRLNVKYVDKNGDKKYVYMLNNTALPSPRIFIAILENFQQTDGTVKVPKVLVPFTGFSEIHPK